ncbi:MAG: rhomboid family intramembrane serine protease [Isosphaeraceae bacterium]
MGIYDREYYRGEAGGPGWFGGAAPWCTTLIIINCAVFLLQNALPRDSELIRDWLEACPAEIFRHGRVWQLWTATFLHAGIFHILGNMWFLWLVGREMESLYGGRDFLAFYLIAGGLSTLGWAVIAAVWGAGMDHFDPAHRHMVGASGAVMAVVTLFTLYYPRREILFFFFPMPMWVVLGIYLVLPIFQERVAYETHLIGAGLAVGFKQFDLRWSRLVGGRFRRSRLKIFTASPVEPQPRTRPTAGGRGTGEGVSVRPSSVSVLPEEQLDAQLDEVLAKIAREGRGALTDEDQRVLQEASRRARNKRSDRP